MKKIFKKLLQNCDLFKCKMNGFTLAEVLITLGIIGIVAAITIPNLVTKYQKKQTTVRLQKVYSELLQTVSLAQVNNCPMEIWDFTNYSDNAARTNDFFENYLMANLKATKKCLPSNSDCWPDKIYTLDHREIVQNDSNTKASFITVSGYSVYGWQSSSGNSAWIYIDLNGPNAKPNQLGKDIFPFQLFWKKSGYKKIGIYPAGLAIENVTREDLLGNTDINSIKYSSCVKGGNFSSAGVYCTGLIVLDNWEIKDDYPW